MRMFNSRLETNLHLCCLLIPEVAATLMPWLFSPIKEIPKWMPSHQHSPTCKLTKVRSKTQQDSIGKSLRALITVKLNPSKVHRVRDPPTGQWLPKFSQTSIRIWIMSLTRKCRKMKLKGPPRHQPWRVVILDRIMLTVQCSNWVWRISKSSTASSSTALTKLGAECSSKKSKQAVMTFLINIWLSTCSQSLAMSWSTNSETTFARSSSRLQTRTSCSWL